jgi:valyl-tRNA synthetase
MILPEKYLALATENKWRKYWHDHQIYQWQNDSSKQQTFVIDTPPPTVSGLLHMGHIFSYTQADFVARFNRTQGKDVFYPMGFDDNGLPTERLVEKIIGKKAGIYENENGRGSFVAKCREVVVEAEQEFEQLFKEIALSVDWEQKYQTISPESQKISQASFVDLFNKGLVEKQNQPVFWDISDRTALAQADIIDKEIEGEMYFFDFAIQGNANNLEIMTTRPELLPACVAVMINGKDDRYQNLILQPLNQEGEGKTGSFAISPIFGVKVPIIADNSVQLDKGTGVVMCCTFGDETDLKWWRKYGLAHREIINSDGSIKKLINVDDQDSDYKNTFADYAIIDEKSALFLIEKNLVLDPKIFIENYQKIASQKIKEAKKIIIELLSNSLIFNSPLEGESKSLRDFGGGSNNIFKSQKIIRPVKCAERSGVPIEIISQPQWFIKILDKKEQLKQQAKKCNWYPEYMRVRIEQWIEGLSWDWCISRQRFFGVKFPVWDLESFNPEDFSQVKSGEWSFDINLASKQIIADISQLPVNPEVDIPLGFTLVNNSEIETAKKIFYIDKNYTFNENNFNKKVVKDSDGKLWFITPETDIMDTWATSSISPQLSSKGISDEIYFDEESQSRHQKLFPADMRPQAHEIIRTWAFYTIVKAYLHSLNRVKTVDGTFAKNVDGSIKLQENINEEISLPWKNLMISGWCLAADKTKMSKSKGNVITPTALIQEKSADVVRYWASASSLGADIAYSEEVFKIGQKLITKLFNSAKFCSQHFAVLQDYFEKNPDIENNDEALLNLVSHPTDLWILNQLEQVINNYVSQFQQFEYAKAREILEDFFWKNFCDNYLEICKVRSYGLSAEKLAGLDLTSLNKQEILENQLSAIATLSLSLKNILKLFAPFVPHLTEELYSIIFASEFGQFKSIHARHNCAKLSLKKHSLISQINTNKIGENLLEIIFAVRKFKSEKNLSMKATISLIELPKSFDITGIEDDVLNVCNAQKIVLNNDLSVINIIE